MLQNSNLYLQVLLAPLGTLEILAFPARREYYKFKLKIKSKISISLRLKLRQDMYLSEILRL